MDKTPDKKEVLFEDIFDKEVEFDEASIRSGKNVCGNARLASGRCRTTEQQRRYKEKSLERELP